MAAALVVPETSRTNREVAIQATGFEADGTLLVAIDEIGLSGAFALDSNGDLADPSPLTFRPTHEGVYTVRVSDGTDELTSRVQVYTTT